MKYLGELIVILAVLIGLTFVALMTIDSINKQKALTADREVCAKYGFSYIDIYDPIKDKVAFTVCVDNQLNMCQPKNGICEPMRKYG